MYFIDFFFFFVCSFISLPRKTDMERYGSQFHQVIDSLFANIVEQILSLWIGFRKIEIVQFASRTRQLFVRLLALVKWASNAGKVEKCAVCQNERRVNCQVRWMLSIHFTLHCILNRWFPASWINRRSCLWTQLTGSPLWPEMPSSMLACPASPFPLQSMSWQQDHIRACPRVYE